MPDTLRMQAPGQEHQQVNPDRSGTTDFFKRFQKAARDTSWEPAFNSLVCGPYEFRKLIDPFFDKLDFVSDNVYDLQETGHLAGELKTVFDTGMNSLLKGNWQQLMAKGANWNDICLAIYNNVARLAAIFGLDQDVRDHMEQWFAYYREHGTSLALKREQREKLNREALNLYKNSSYARLSDSPEVEQTLAANRARLAEIQTQLNTLGDDPNPETHGVFTRAYHRAVGNEIIEPKRPAPKPTYKPEEPKVIIQEKARQPVSEPVAAKPKSAAQPSVPRVHGPEKLEEASPWTETKRSRLLWQPKKKQGFLDRVKKVGSTIAGWFGR